MKEILGFGLEGAFTALDIHAELRYKGAQFEVWAISDKSYDRLCAVPDEEWKDKYGWWRWGECILEGSPLWEYTVNNQKMLGYLDEGRLDDLIEGEEPEDKLDETFYTEREYESYTDWLCEVMSCSTEKHIACFAVSLAKANGLSLAEFMEKYQ